jgi:glycosyltransferase involved in cell wall biosynthesis
VKDRECRRYPKQGKGLLAVAAAGEGGVHSQLISVVVTTQNRASLLGTAIDSVLPSPLIMSPEQIIVVDDDSQDRTEEVARQFGVRYLRVAHHNISASRDAGLALAHAPYITFLDDDDVWLPGNMEVQLAALQAHPNAAFAYGIAQNATEYLEPLPLSFPLSPLPSGLVPDDLHRYGYPHLAVVLFRREAVAAVGGFDRGIRYGEDADLLLRIAARHEIVSVEVVGMLHRLRPPSKARSDYFWASARREVTQWRPKHVGVRWRTAAKFRFQTKGLFCSRFWEDAAACVALGHRHDALICLWRAVWISPAHALRHFRTMLSIFW